MMLVRIRNDKGCPWQTHCSSGDSWQRGRLDSLASEHAGRSNAGKISTGWESMKQIHQVWLRFGVLHGLPDYLLNLLSEPWTIMEWGWYGLAPHFFHVSQGSPNAGLASKKPYLWCVHGQSIGERWPAQKGYINPGPFQCGKYMKIHKSTWYLVVSYLHTQNQKWIIFLWVDIEHKIGWASFDLQPFSGAFFGRVLVDAETFTIAPYIVICI